MQNVVLSVINGLKTKAYRERARGVAAAAFRDVVISYTVQ